MARVRRAQRPDGKRHEETCVDIAQIAPPVEPAPIDSIPDGYRPDFLTGKLVRDTPEEYVRQNIEKALVRQFKYAPVDCEPEFRIKVGSSGKRVDIVVFRDGQAHSQARARILVETKKAGTSPSDKKEGIGQLQSYMAACVNAEYGLWTNGDERYAFAKRSMTKGIEFQEIVQIPAAGQSEEEAQRPHRRDLVPATADNLLFAFRRCHNFIAGTEGLQKPEAFWELLKLIFCKIEDERSAQIDFFVTPTELTSATAAATAKARIQKIFADKVLPNYPGIFPGEEAQRLNLKPNSIAFVVGQLQSYSLLESAVDVKGVAYEEVVGSNLRGDRGEFFTPRNACRMAVAMLDPHPDEKLLDPACGTGGFLIIAMNYALEILQMAERKEWKAALEGTPAEVDELRRKRNQYLSRMVFGLDLNPSLVRAAKMNMVMNNDGSGQLYQANSLANPHSWESAAREDIGLGTFDVLFTNPPFGANILITDEEVLSQYDLANRWRRDTDSGLWEAQARKDGTPVLQKAVPPEILFVERCVQFLKPGTGRMAMVIPNGILNNPALGYIRQWLLRNCQILAVVDMHRDLFQPKNDTQTSMVFLRRLRTEEAAIAAAQGLKYEMFMAVAESVGHDKRGALKYRRTPQGEDVLRKRIEAVPAPDGYREIEVVDRVIDDELPDVAEAYRRWLSGQRP
jgi:type I restriction enzyme M protein